MKKIKGLLRNIRLIKNRIGSKKRNQLLLHKDVTIISNNCYAGLTYEYLHMKFFSPTIGLYFFAPEYIKFIRNLKYYTHLELQEIPVSESKYFSQLHKLKQDNVIIGKLEDVEIVFLHYKNFAIAKEKWTRRCKRINYSKIIFKFNDQNLCTEKELETFFQLPFPNKICFTSKNYQDTSNIWLKKYKNAEFVKEDIYNSRKYFDIIDYINHMKIEKK